LIRDLYIEPPNLVNTYRIGDGKPILTEEYILEDNLTIAQDEKQLWNLLRMKIPLSLPYIEMDETQSTSNFVSFYKQNIRYLKYTDEDMDQHLHICFKKVVQIFPN
jgi:hypothetical protein